MLEELLVPLEKTYSDEFNRYSELFYKYVPKRPFHHRFRYGDGFDCAKGQYKPGTRSTTERAIRPSSASIWITGGGSTAAPARIIRRTTGWP